MACTWFSYNAHPHVKLAIQRCVECGDRKKSIIYNRLMVDKVRIA